jgi:hypothetical protein
MVTSSVTIMITSSVTIMNLTNFLLYLMAGRLVTWLLQTAGLLRPLWQRHPLLMELSGCDLCLGFWVYLALALAYRGGKLFGLWPGLIERIILAGLSALGAHLVRLGWEDRFGVTVIRG